MVKEIIFVLILYHVKGSSSSYSKLFFFRDTLWAILAKNISKNSLKNALEIETLKTLGNYENLSWFLSFYFVLLSLI